MIYGVLHHKNLNYRTSNIFTESIDIDGCGLAPLEGYNLGLAIASIFIIFSASFAGAILPVSLAFSSHPLLVRAVHTLAYAGAGVLLATGFMHLLLPAQEALTSECLSESFVGSYPSYAFLFCVISIACMQVLDYFVTVKIAKRAPPSLAGAEELNQREEETASASATATAVGRSTTGAGKEDIEAGACVVHTVCKDSNCTGQTLLYSNKSTTLKAQISAVLLSEASISVHSILIGITLGITTGDEIVPLLIALTFHQFLEGVVIGTASIYAGMQTRSFALLGVIFALTTPVGIAIGIGVRYSFNENNPSALLTQGILDAICGGMLIFLALGDHVNAMKNQAHWLKEEGTVIHGTCIGAFLLGMAIMCTLAVWV
jgi:zinc transporter 1/2/3